MRCSNGRCFIPWIDNLQFRNTALVVGVALVPTDIPIRHHLEVYRFLSIAHISPSPPFHGNPALVQ